MDNVKSESQNNSNLSMDGEMQQKGNLGLALIGGILSFVINVAMWIAVAKFIGINSYYYIFCAISMGITIALVKKLGKGKGIIFMIIGGLFSLLSCFIGLHAGILFLYAQDLNMPYIEMLQSLDLMSFKDLVIAEFWAVDLVMYAVVTFFGAKGSICSDAE